MPLLAMLGNGAAHLFVQGVLATENLSAEKWDAWAAIKSFVNTPAPFSPFTEYLFVLFVLWLLARRNQRKREDFSKQAQDVLEQKFESGELTRTAYDKFRQDLELRPKR